MPMLILPAIFLAGYLTVCGAVAFVRDVTAPTTHERSVGDEQHDKEGGNAA